MNWPDSHYLWGKHVLDTIHGSMQGDSPYKVDEEDQVGESGCEVHNLWRLDRVKGSAVHQWVLFDPLSSSMKAHISQHSATPIQFS